MSLPSPAEAPETAQDGPDARSAYLDALLGRVATMEPGDALAVLLRSILERLERIEALANEPAELPDLASVMAGLMGGDGRPDVGKLLGLLRQ